MLTLWKLHSKTCKETNKKEFQSLAPDQHRFFKKCQCACHVTGVHPKTKAYIKQSLHVTSWDAAKKQVEELEGSTPSEIEARKVKVEDALKKFFAFQRNQGVAESTLETGYGPMGNVLLAYCKDEGVVLMSQLTRPVVCGLIESEHWTKWAASTRNRQLGNLRAFFNYALLREWITGINPTMGIKRAAEGEQAIAKPYSPEEDDRLEVAFGNWTEKVQTRSGAWSSRPTTLHCLKHVLEDTGLRISDAIRFHPSQVCVLPSGDGQWELKQSKLDGVFHRKCAPVTVYLRRSTLEEAARIPWMSESFPFLQETRVVPGRNEKAERTAWKRHLHNQAINVYNAMQVVGKVAGIEDCRPHRFRHTFSEKMRYNNVPFEKIARLLGHATTKMLHEYYGDWTPRIQDQLKDERVEEFERERKVQQMPKPAKVG